MDSLFFSILLIFIGLILGFSLSFVIAYLRKNNASREISIMLDNAKNEAEKIKRNAINEQKEENDRIKADLAKEIKEKKAELKDSEERLLLRETNMDKRDELYQKRESLLDEKEERLTDRFNEIQEEKSKVDEVKIEQLKLLEEISGFTEKEAKDYLMNNLKSSMDLEMSNYIRDREQSAKLQADKIAKEMIVSSMQRYAADIASDQTVTVVDLPNDDMKGRIIGREGRNIRTIEAVTGVDLIIDDTPEAVVLSSFDPLRREIARVVLDTLIKDGRIHPTRIEEVYDKVCKDMKDKIMDYGNDALFELGITQMDSELVELLGKMHFRTSFGQNALQHSIEVSHLSGVLASEFGEDVSLAKRAGLLHDIGKSIDHDIEGSHVELGVKIAKKFNEDDVVINSIASHHGDCDAKSIIASIVSIADSLSASRPGARNDSLENYIKRLTQLEDVGNQIPGVEKAFAVQAGRELRVIVKPEDVDDAGAYKIAREVKEQVENTMKYPGTIKITVVREIRAQEEAK